MKKLFTVFIICLFLYFPLTTYGQLNLEIASQVQFEGNDYGNDIWGYVDEEGREYAILGRGYGTSVYDVTDPAAPEELYSVSGANSTWRDAKVYNNYAYIVDDQAGQGMLIINLENAPEAFEHKFWYGWPECNGEHRAHNIWIDENGFAYLFGASCIFFDPNTGIEEFDYGMIILDLKTDDPFNPEVVGVYDSYVHDGFVRGDTAWLSQVFDGKLVVADVSDKANIVQLGETNTSSNFTHNCWVSDDNKYVYTTDEVSNGFIDAYDVSDVTDIQFLDKIQSSPGSGVIPHNTFVVGDFLVTSYYTDGVTIHDAKFPDHLVEVGNFDTSPNFIGSGFNGCWGVYPYLPSGNILASDIEEGLLVLRPTYEYSARLLVNVHTNGIPLPNITVKLGSEEGTTNFLGQYKYAQLEEETVTVEIISDQFDSQTLTGVELIKGERTVLDVELVGVETFIANINVVDENNNPVPSATVIYQTEDTEGEILTNENGIAQFTTFDFEGEQINVIAGAWGYQATGLATTDLNGANNTLTVQIESGYYDDFFFDYAWTVEGDAQSGIWERGEPFGTDFFGLPFNPEFDVAGDIGDQCYVTGNASTSSAGADDVDDGYTRLTSPPMDLTGMENITISYHRWFANDGGQGSPPNDQLDVYLSNGSETVKIDSVGSLFSSSNELNTWIFKEIEIDGLIELTSNMTVSFETSDLPDSGHLVDAALDQFKVEASEASVVDNNSKENLEQLSHVPFVQADNGSDIWGYVDENGREYAIFGRRYGTTIYDVTNPDAPEELYVIPGGSSTWRDIKIYNDHAYVVDDQAGEGLLIINLENAPESFEHEYWYGWPECNSNHQAHNIWIDENGFAYLFGASCNFVDNGNDESFEYGMLVLDLNMEEPTNPVVVGQYDEYVHDGFVRGDTAWLSQVFDGELVIADVSDKANIAKMGAITTSGSFTHNCWVSDDNKYVYTTDEISSGFIDAYDASDPSDIQFLDKVQSSPGENVIPHNTFVYGDFLITSYYADGATIHDAKFPDQLVEVGHYDTSPNFSGSGFVGCWGVYPYLPSGNILASDMQEGLYVLRPTYDYAARVLVNVHSGGIPIPNVNVQFGDLATTATNFLGQAKYGQLEEDVIDVFVDSPQFGSASVENVALIKGERTVVDIELDAVPTFMVNVNVVDENDNPISNVQVGYNAFDLEGNLLTDENGSAQFTTFDFEENQFFFVAGAWGYRTATTSSTELNTDNNEITIQLERGYYDDFYLDFEWEVSGDAAEGAWEKGEPNGTDAFGINLNPEFDVEGDIGDECYVTGNTANTNPGGDDVDDGYTKLSSPVFDLSNAEEVSIHYHRWFANIQGNAIPNDTLNIFLDNGIEIVKIDSVVPMITPVEDYFTWISKEIDPEGIIEYTENMRIHFEASDLEESGNIVEAGVDLFEVRGIFNDPPDTTSTSIESLQALNIKTSPNPFKDQVNIQLDELDYNGKTMVLEIYDITGKRIYQKDVNTDVMSINTEQWAPNMYFYQIKEDRQVLASGKLLKQ